MVETKVAKWLNFRLCKHSSSVYIYNYTPFPLQQQISKPSVNGDEYCDCHFVIEGGELAQAGLTISKPMYDVISSIALISNLRLCFVFRAI